MKRLYSALCGVLTFTAVATAQQQKNGSYQVEGNLKGLGNETVTVLMRSAQSPGKTDTLRVKATNDKFSFSGKVNQSSRVEFYLGDIKSRKSATFFMEPGKIKIEGDVNSLNRLSITGTPTNNDMTETDGVLVPIYERRSALFQKVRSLDNKSEEFAKIQKEIKEKTDSVNAYKLSFMQSRPNSGISHGYLYVLQDGLPTSTVETIYNSFPTDWKKSSEGQYIYTKLQADKTVAVGNMAPDFTTTDKEGNKVKLSDYKGKYVLLEFWAYWCVPCRAQHPHLKEIYDRYNKKGFTIFQYSVDYKKDEQKWRDAIKQDGLVWTQTSDLVVSGKPPVAVTYGVQPIPDNFLIAPDGKILGRRLNPKQLEEMLQKLLK